MYIYFFQISHNVPCLMTVQCELNQSKVHLQELLDETGSPWITSEDNDHQSLTMIHLHWTWKEKSNVILFHLYKPINLYYFTKTRLNLQPCKNWAFLSECEIWLLYKTVWVFQAWRLHHWQFRVFEFVMQKDQTNNDFNRLT